MMDGNKDGFPIKPWRPSTYALLERLRRIDVSQPPTIHRERLALAFHEHFHALNLSTREVEWVPDLEVNQEVLSPLIGKGEPDVDWREALRRLRQAQGKAVDTLQRKRLWHAAGRAGRRAIQAMRWYGISFTMVGAPVEGPCVYEAGEAVAIEETLWDHSEFSRWRSVWQLYVACHEAGMMWYTVLPDRVIVVPRPVLSLAIRTTKQEAVRWSGSRARHFFIQDKIKGEMTLVGKKFSR